jgi:hypothetical protein
LSLAEAPPPAASPTPPAPPEPTAVAPARRGPAWLDAVWSPAIVILVAALIVVSAAGGGGLGPTVRAELLVLLGAAAVTVAALLRTDVAHVPGGYATGAFVALAALTGTSLLWAVDPAGAWLEANRTIAYAAAFIGAASLAVAGRDRATAFAGGLLLGLVLVCGLALLSKIVPEWLNENERFARLREPFGYWNAVGLTGALCVPLCLWLGSRRLGPPLVNALAFPALTLAFTTILLAYSRGSLLAAAAGAAVWFVLVPARRLRGAAILLLGAAAAAFVTAWTFGQNALTEDNIELAERGTAGRELLVCLVAVLLLVYVGGIVVSFLSDLRPLGWRSRRGLGIALLCCVALVPVALAGVLSTTDEGLGGSVSKAWETISDPQAEPPTNEAGRLTQTGSVRAPYWADAYEMAKDRPLGGFGANGFEAAAPRYRTDDIDVKHAHSYVAQTLADLGIAGIVVSLVLLIAWGFAVRAALRAATGPRRTVLVTLTAVAVVFGVHSTVDWTWFTTGTALVGLLAAGYVAGAAPPSRLTLGLSGPARLVAAGIVVVLALAAGWSAWQPLRSAHASDDALALIDRGDIEAARQKAAEAHDLNPLSAEPYLALASVERQGGSNDRAEAALVQATDRQPAIYTTWVRLAEFQLWIQDDPRAALESIRNAVYLNPGSFMVIQRYLDIYRTLKTRETRGG